MPWSVRSPDLTSCDSWLWGYLKSRMFILKPRTIPERKQCIGDEITAIPQVMIRKETAIIQKKACVDTDGNHSSDIIFYKQNCIVRLTFYSYYEDSDIFSS